MPTNVSGTIKNLNTTTPGTSSFVRFWLRGCRGNTPRITSTGAIAPQPAGNNFYVDVPADASGNVSASIYSTRDNAGTGNGEIEVGGSYTAVWYGMVIYNAGIPGPEVPVHAKISGSIDISSVTPISIPPVVTSPTGDTTYARLDGGNAPFTGQVVGKNGAVGSPSFTFASSLTTGFWRQAADVIGVSIAGALKWLINAAGLLFGSGQAIGFSSNADPSAAGGDIFLNRQAANKAGLGTTANTKDGILLLSKIAAGGVEATGSIAGDSTAARSATVGAVFLGTDGAGQLFRSGDSVSIAGTTKNWALPAISGTLANGVHTFQQFTSNGTFTIPAGVTAVKVTLLGAGGAGGGGTATANTGGPGGGSGGCAIKWLSGLTPGNTIAVTVGTGGTGVSGGAGNNGGNSTIASGTQAITTVTAGGGAGAVAGAAGGAFGGAGGTCTNGDINLTGNIGMFMIGNTNTGQCGTASVFGGAPNGAGAGNNPGNAGNAPGAGGSGAGGGTANTTGGAGANGIVIFEWVK